MGLIFLTGAEKVISFIYLAILPKHSCDQGIFLVTIPKRQGLRSPPLPRNDPVFDLELGKETVVVVDF